MTQFAIAWRVLVIVVLVGLAWSVPDLLGLEAWVGLVLGVVVALVSFAALGFYGNAARPPSR